MLKRLAGSQADSVAAAADGIGLLAALAAIDDPRSRFGRRYPLPVVLALAICAVTCDANSFTAIAEWATDLHPDLLARFGLRAGRFTGRIRVPSEKTFRTVLTHVDPAQLLDAAGRFACYRLTAAGMPRIPAHLTREREQRRREKTRHTPKPPVVAGAKAADGKTLRGSGRTRHDRTHLLGLVAHHGGELIDRYAVDGKTSEVPGLRTLLTGTDLAGAVLTVDAAHTCKESARAIRAAGGHYLMVVKTNTPTLHAAIAALLTGGTDAQWLEHGTAHAWTETGHGRTAERIVRVAEASGVDFPGAAQVLLTVRRRTVTATGLTSKEVVLAVTSLPPTAAGPPELAMIQQGHWSSEVRHWILDVTFGEDACQARTGNAPENLSTLRDIARQSLDTAKHVNKAAGRRHFTHRPDRALDLYKIGQTA